ncbi:MAG: hypothetical protein J1F38_09200 [Muribaculaceae bacterium]|nr:hypothetical protein [Muribaculaceae bacterium]
MKITYIKSLAIVGPALLLGGCTDNSWNNTFLDGFSGEPTYDNAVTVNYTLTTTDYETIGQTLYNLAETDEQKAAANFIRNNHYFDQNSIYPAQVAVPYLLNQEKTDFYIYNDGSMVQVSLMQAETPAEVAAISAAPRMVLEKAPAAVAAIPGMLLSEYPDAQAGDYAIVSYPGSNSGSGSGSGNGGSGNNSGNGGGSVSTELTSNIKDLYEGETLTATAVVTAQSTRGLILTDKAGSIFYYNNNVDLSTYPIGTIVNVSGSVAVYGGFQLTNSATLTKVGSQSYSYPTPTTYTSTMISDAIVANTPNTAQYISFEGTLDINGNYYNINIPGVDNGQGSLYTPTDALKAKMETGKTYTFTGYFTGITSSKYFYMVLTDVNEAGTNSRSSYSGKTRDSYWTVAQALSQIANGYEGEATVEGYIIAISELSTSYGNATYTIADNATDKEGLIVYRGYYFNGDKFTSEDQIKVGDKVVVTGSLVNYGGTTPEFTTGSKIISLNGEGGSAGGDNSGSGGGDNNNGGNGNTNPGGYWSVSEALSKMASGFEGEATVGGYIINISDVSPSYGNATYTIADSESETTGLLVYRGYYLNGDKFTSEDQIKMGDKVVVKGSLVNYNGTYEFTTGSQIMSLNGEGGSSIVFDEATAINLVYMFDGSAWAPAENAVAMNGEAYTALDLTPNSLNDPAIYLPIYMKNTYPYMAAGTETYVAYNLGNNSSACALMTYDGNNWTYVDNYIQDKVAAFGKSGGKYSFRKYIGEEVFNFYEGETLALNCSYLIVYGGVCMDPVPTGKSYGYPGETEITINDGSIVMPNGDNAFTFTTTTEYNGNTYTTPEGYFLILDSNGRYMYLQGTYSSFNVRSNNAYIDNDGTINVQYLFKATRESDGTWRIVNEQPDITRTLYYSDGNNDFAGYTEEQLTRYTGRLPYLYISETSTPIVGDTTE